MNKLDIYFPSFSGQGDGAAQTNRKNNTRAGQKTATVTHWQKPGDVWQEEAGNQQWLQEGRGAEEEGVILPYMRLGGDISSPNLVEGTCREASCTYRGKPCGRFPGGKVGGSPWKEGWRFPRWGGVGNKGVGGVTSSQKVAKSRREDGRGKGRKTQKSLLIRFPGYHDLECHLSWI